MAVLEENMKAAEIKAGVASEEAIQVVEELTRKLEESKKASMDASSVLGKPQDIEARMCNMEFAAKLAAAKANVVDVKKKAIAMAAAATKEIEVARAEAVTSRERFFSAQEAKEKAKHVNMRAEGKVREEELASSGTALEENKAQDAYLEALNTMADVEENAGRAIEALEAAERLLTVETVGVESANAAKAAVIAMADGAEKMVIACQHRGELLEKKRVTEANAEASKRALADAKVKEEDLCHALSVKRASSQEAEALAKIKADVMKASTEKRQLVTTECAASVSAALKAFEAKCRVGEAKVASISASVLEEVTLAELKAQGARDAAKGAGDMAAEERMKEADAFAMEARMRAEMAIQLARSEFEALQASFKMETVIAKATADGKVAAVEAEVAAAEADVDLAKDLVEAEAKVVKELQMVAAQAKVELEKMEAVAKAEEEAATVASMEA